LPNKIKKAIIRPNSAIASVNAKPNIAYIKSWRPTDGFLENPMINAPKTVPIPTPDPARAIVAKPAPIILAAFNNIFKRQCLKFWNALQCF
jgi:hypothetical protein